MKTQTIEAYADQILNFSQQMYLLARHDDWDALAKLEKKRTNILDFLFDNPSMPSSLASVADILQCIIDVDNKTMTLGKEAQKTLDDEMKLFKQSKGARAVDAYLDNTI